MSEPDGARNQEQIAASHEIDGVRKEKERLTAASLNKPAAIHRRSVLAISVLVLPAVNLFWNRMPIVPSCADFLFHHQ